MAFFQRKPTAKIIQLRTVTPSPSASARLIVQDFIQNTSLLGVQHFLRTKSYVWLLAYLICVSMSIVQSWHVTVIFFQGKTVNTVTVSSKPLIPFPSVTVCTNFVLREDFNFSKVPGFDTEVYRRLLEECGDLDVMHELKDAMEKNREAVRLYMRHLTEEERLNLGLKLSEVIQTCRFASKPCNLSDPNEVFIYSSSEYGNCFTFNPAFNDSIAKYATTENMLMLYLRFPSRGYWLTGRSRAKLGVQIHPPGTAPLMEDPAVEDVFHDDIVFLAVILESETISLKKRTSSIPSCIESNDETYRRRSVHYTEKAPYMYSQEACLKSCKEDAYHECGYLYVHTPPQSREYEKDKKLAYTTESDCELKTINMEACDCPIPCRKTTYQVIRDHNDIFHIPCNKKPSHPNKNKTRAREYEHESRIYVWFNSGVYQIIQEDLSYELSAYLGILGGNMSLWIGLCIISLLEVIELCIRLIVATLKRPHGQPKVMSANKNSLQKHR